MKSIAQQLTERQALDAAIAAATPLYHATPPLASPGGAPLQVVAMQRYHQASKPAVVAMRGSQLAAAVDCYTVIEPHVARELAANLIHCAEIAERHNLDTARREARCEERIALADAISPGAVSAASC